MLDAGHRIGRIFGKDWTIANVARLLRFNAAQGQLRAVAAAGSLQDPGQDDYLRRTAARHLPSGVVVTFRRDPEGDYQAGLTFAGVEDYFPWNDIWAEQWLTALFLEDRPRIRETPAPDPNPRGTRYFTLA